MGGLKNTHGFLTFLFFYDIYPFSILKSKYIIGLKGRR